MLAAGYAERERIKQEQGSVLLFWFLLSALFASSSVLFSLLYIRPHSCHLKAIHLWVITVVALENSFFPRDFD